jgi:hypothetical protein
MLASFSTLFTYFITFLLIIFRLIDIFPYYGILILVIFTHFILQGGFILNKRKQKFVALGLASFIGLGTLGATQAASVVKTLKATYNNIKITYDGALQSPNMEPFMVDNTVYVSLRDAGQITGNSVAWENNTVKITSGTSSNAALEQQIVAKNFEITKLQAEKTQLQAQVTALQAQLNTQKEEETSTSDLKTVLSNIRKTYEASSRSNLNMEWYIDLKTNSRGDTATLTLTYTTKADRDKFESTSDSRVQTFLKDVCEDIYKGLGIKVEGEIIDDYRTSTTMADFSYSTSGRLTYTRARTQTTVNQFAKDLEDDFYNSLPALLLTSSSISGAPAAPTHLTSFGKTFTLTITETSQDTFEFVIQLALSENERTAWNGTHATYLNEANLLKFMATIRDEIAYEFDVDTNSITGYVSNGNTTMLRYTRNRIISNGI